MIKLYNLRGRLVETPDERSAVNLIASGFTRAPEKAKSYNPLLDKGEDARRLSRERPQKKQPLSGSQRLGKTYITEEV